MWRRDSDMRNILFGLWVLGGLALFILAVVYCATSYRFKLGAIVLTGEVIGSSEPSQSQRTASPIVRYVMPSGEQREYKYSAPLTGGAYWIGEKVKVLYDPQSGRTKLDGWSELYLLPSLLGFTAFLILLPPIASGVIYWYVRSPRRTGGGEPKGKI
jgi:hypothetical protein